MATCIWCVHAHVHSFLYHTINPSILFLIFNRLIIAHTCQSFIDQRYINCMRSVPA